MHDKIIDFFLLTLSMKVKKVNSKGIERLNHINNDESMNIANK